MVVNVRSGEIVIGTEAGVEMEWSSPPAKVKEESSSSFRSQCRFAEERSAKDCRTVISPLPRNADSPDNSGEFAGSVEVDEEQKDLQPESPCGGEMDTSNQDSHGRPQRPWRIRRVVGARAQFY